MLAALSENRMKFLLRRQEGESDGAGEGYTISYHGDTPSWYRKLRVNPHVTWLVVQTETVTVVTDLSSLTHT